MCERRSEDDTDVCTCVSGRPQVGWREVEEEGWGEGGGGGGMCEGLE